MGIAKRVRRIIGNDYQLECRQCGRLEWVHLEETDNRGWKYVDSGNYWLCPDCQS